MIQATFKTESAFMYLARMKNISHELVKKCLTGDRIAQKEVFELFYAPLFRVVQRYLANNAQAEDCLMRGFMKLFQQLHSFQFQGEHSLFLWSKKIVINEALMELRKRNNFFLLSEGNLSELPDTTESFNQVGDEELFQLLLLLPEGYRTVFNLYVIEEFSHKEIADMLGIKESTSKSQYRKARLRLQQLIIKHKDGFYGKFRK